MQIISFYQCDSYLIIKFRWSSLIGKKDSLLNAIAAEPLKDSHIGDLNNLVADENGEATVDIKFEHSPRPSLFEGETNILRRTLVIHAGS